MLELLGDSGAATVAGLAGGVVLGLAARMGRFCTLGAIEDLLYGGCDLRARMWGVAIAVAVLASFGLVAIGALDPEQTVYLSVAWFPMASITGGLLFGYGMALAGNCGFGALARAGGGDLRAFVILLVMGLAAYATMSGPLAWARVLTFPPVPPSVAPGIAHGIAAVTGLWVPAIGLVLGAGLLIAAIAPSRMRAAPASIGWGALVGLSVACGWAATQWIADTGFDGRPVVSHSFAAPIGETMLYAMTATGRSLSFGVGSVAGVLIGSFLGSLARGQFRWEACEDPRELGRQLAGASLMGVGAVLAVGCSVGQGLSAFSVLAWSAPVTLAAIVAGAAFGLRQLIAGFTPAE